MQIKYRITVLGETESKNVEFNFHTKVELHVHDVIVRGEKSFFLHEKTDRNLFLGYEIGNTVNAFS